jgi:hypothetical protein
MLLALGTESACYWELFHPGDQIMQCKCCGAHADLSVSNLISAAEQALETAPINLGTNENPICLSCAESALDGLEQLNWLRNARAGNRLCTWRRLWALSFGRDWARHSSTLASFR